MAARSKSVEASPDAGPAPGLTPSRGSGAPLRMLKRTVMLETVSKSVTERKESTKQVTDQATGVERRRDSHIESSTTEEVRSKRQEETVESYDSTPLPAASQPTLGTQPQAATVAGGGVSVPDVSVDASRKTSPKYPVAIRVKDDHADEDIASSSAPTMSEAPSRPAVPLTSHGSTTSILRAPSHEDVENRKSTGHKLEFQEEEPEYHRAELVKPPADLALKAAASSDQGEDDDEVAEPPPSRFNMRRKDSIAVTKLRMLRQQEEGSEEEPADEDEAPDPGATSPEKKHPVFRPPTVISIVPEEEVSMASEAVDSAEGKGPPPAADDCKAADDKPQTITESSTHVDKQVTSTEKQEVQTFPNETVTRVNADEVVKQTKSEVITETTTMMPREASAAAIVATVVGDESSTVKTPMDDRSKHSL